MYSRYIIRVGHFDVMEEKTKPEETEIGSPMHCGYILLVGYFSHRDTNRFFELQSNF